MTNHFWIVSTLLCIVFTFSLVYTDKCDDCEFQNQILSGCPLAPWTKCPNTTNTTTAKECEQLGCCHTDNSSFVQEKNLSVNCITRRKSGSTSIGTCERYKLDDTLCPGMAYNNATRYFDKTYNVNGTIVILNEFKSIVDKLKMTEDCQQTIQKGLCQFVIPNCVTNSSTAKAQVPCREDCELIFKDCSNNIQQLFGALQWVVLEKDINFNHLSIPYSCMPYNFSYDLPEGMCAKIFANIDRTRPTEESNSSPKMVIIISAVAAFLLVLSLLMAVICLIRHRRIKQNTQQTEMDHISNMTSIREHLRADTIMSNPLEELLASSKPGELLQYPLDCVEYIKELGEGQFGKVFQGRVHGIVKGEESTDVAVKCLKEGSSEVAKASFNQEVALMSVLQHENILMLLAVSTEEEPYCMIFEFMENGDLNEFLRRWYGKDYLNDSQLIKICKYIACGMEYLASKKFLHRDLATRNCLVGQNLMVKIADFGMSRNVYHSDYYRVGGEAMLPIRWMPPESILYGKFTVSSDVYSFGVVVWEVFSFAIQPFYGYSNEEVVNFIKKGVLLPMPEDCPEWIYNIMLACWKRDPEERLSFTKALQLLKGKFEDTNEEKYAENHESVISSHPIDQSEGVYDKVISSRPIDQSEGEYDQITFNDNKDYDIIWNSQNDNKIQHGDEPSGPSYVNMKPEGKQGNGEPASNETPSLQILSPIADTTTSPPSSPISPGTTNNGFHDDEAMLLKVSNSPSSISSKEDMKSKSLTPLGKRKRNSAKLNTFKKADSGDRSPRAFLRTSVGGGFSIKDVMREGARYVSSEDVRKNISRKNSNEEVDLPTALRESGYHSAFRPTSEFMPFHGYGESIQANDPDEAKLIRKIIEDGR